MNTLRALVLSCLVACVSPLSAQEAPRPFVAGSLSEILAAHAGKSFMLLFWSLECPSCLRELGSIASEANKYPGMRLVMVSTDGADQRDEVAGMLAKHGLNRVESWVFDAADAQRLRYEVDKSWYGELPRSYFYDAGHHREALSGVVTTGQIEAWLSAGR